MNLTNKLRQELVKAVVLDQYQDIANELNNEISSQISKELFAKYGEFSAEALKLQSKHGLNALPCHQRVTLGFCARFSIDGKVIIKIGDYASLNFTLVTIHSPYLSENGSSDELKAIYEKANIQISEACKLSQDLAAVLASVKTVKKLQELTNVFDPFLPKDAITGTGLIPTEQLLRINELKTPKGKSK